MRTLKQWWFRKTNCRRDRLTCVVLSGLARPRHFSVPLLPVSLVLLFLFVSGIWSALSAVVLPAQAARSLNLSETITATEHGLLTYVRYEGEVAVTGIKRPETPPPILEPLPGPVATAAFSAAVDGSEKAEMPKVKPEVKVEPAPEKKATQAVVIKNVKIRDEDPSKLGLEFEIHNRRREKARGFLWAIAHVRTASGEDLYLSAHGGVAEAGPEPADPKGGETYGVKKFRRVQLAFDLPASVTGEFQGVTYGLTDVDGRSVLTDKRAVAH